MREVYRRRDGSLKGATVDGAVPSGASVSELRQALVMMLRATYEPVFRVSEITGQEEDDHNGQESEAI